MWLHAWNIQSFGKTVYNFTMGAQVQSTNFEVDVLNPLQGGTFMDTCRCNGTAIIAFR